MIKKNNPNSKNLRSMIENGAFMGGEGRLPPERILASELGIMRSALRKILGELEAEGLIWRQVGKGTFIRTGPIPAAELSSVLAVQTNPFEIMEVMFILQPKIASMTALKANHRDIEYMARCSRNCEQADDLSSRLKWDYLLHDTMAKSTNNKILRAISEYLYRTKVWGRRREAVFTPDRWPIYNRQHNQLIQAIQERDPAKAFDIMAEHIETVRKHLLDEK